MNRKLLVSPDITLLQAMDALTKGEEKIVFVVDPDDVLLGTLTDGDVRRFILAGHPLSSSIREAFNPQPVFVRHGAYSPHELRALFQAHPVEVIPVVDAAGCVVDHLSWHGLLDEPVKRSSGAIDGVPVVIMAGGLGTRLQPFTHVLPKPLLPIDGKPVIDHIIERFRAVGASTFYVTVNHKARILRAYLDGTADNGITLIEEDAPLGTAGALRLLAGRFETPVLVTNCDVLLAVDYRELLDFHVTSGCAMTVVASVRSVRLPYGACDIGEDGTLRGIEEKPALTRLVSTGVYVMSPCVLDDIPPADTYSMITLIADVMRSGKRVAVFPVSAHAWADVGQWREYQRATRVIAHHEPRAKALLKEAGRGTSPDRVEAS